MLDSEPLFCERCLATQGSHETHSPTYLPIIPCLIYSFQLLTSLSVVTLALHLVRWLLRDASEYVIHPMTPPTRSHGSAIAGVAAKCYHEWGFRLDKIKDSHGLQRGGEKLRLCYSLTVEQVTSAKGRKSSTMIPTTRSGTLAHTAVPLYV